MKLLMPNLNTLWASLLVEELVRCGVDYFCLAPGSRSTPLTVAAAAHDQAVTSIHYDERGVAFHALGYGRATGRPAVVITTSGTAVANLMPAVVEASLEGIPLLVLTGDRPPELRDTCANQTIDQVKLFGGYVRWFADVPCPTRAVPPAFVLTTVDQAVYRCRHGFPGPVHVNCMFRGPLAPEPDGMDHCEYLGPVKRWMETALPYTQYHPTTPLIEESALDRVAETLNEARRGLVVIGGLAGGVARDGVCALLKRLQWPVCADIASGLRIGDTTGFVVETADILAACPEFSVRHAPETVLHIGGRLVSKQTEQFLHQGPCRHLLISDHRGRQDPGHHVTDRLEGNVDSLCRDLAERISPPSDSFRLPSWRVLAARAETYLEEFAAHATTLSEPLVARLISKVLPENHGLFLANSTPVRSMNRFADGTGAAVCVGANRGASGIDGTVATASGFAVGLKRPVTLLTGDLALLHDLNSLRYSAESRYPVVIVVINNDGGGIFSFLPIARYETYFERYFVTPHGLSFEKAAAMYRLPYSHPTGVREFLAAYEQAVKADVSSILEVTVDRQTDHALHVQLADEICGLVVTAIK